MLILNFQLHSVSVSVSLPSPTLQLPSMEVSLSTNHHSLSVTSRGLRSSSPFSLSNLRFIRTQFLGCAHNLKPHGGLRSRKKCSKLGLLHVHSPRFIFKASLDSPSIIVVVIIVTLSALSLIYFSHSKRKKNTKEILGHTKFALSRQVSSVGNQLVENQVLGFQEFQVENALKKFGIMKNKTKESNPKFEHNEAQLQFWRSSVVYEAAVMTKTSELSSDVLTSSVNNSFSSDSFEIEDRSCLAFQSSLLKPLTFVENQDKVDCDPELPITMYKSEHTASSVCLSNAFTTVNELAKENIGPGAINSNILFGESVMQELHMFYEVNKSAERSMSPLQCIKSSSPHAYSMNINKLPSAMGNATLKGSELSTEISPQNEGNIRFGGNFFYKPYYIDSEYIEREVPIASYKDGYPSLKGSKNLSKGSTSLGERARNHLSHKNNKAFRVHVDQKNHRSEHLSTYNRLLKVGRLPECVELLKNMETKGLLDMTKVYHAKFFNICKRQKAVREAFDYTKLIPNPKLSTFNMLMSVCSTSQDSEGAFQVLQLVQGAGLEPDCKLYTTLISTCAKSAKVDQMFEVFHKMVNSGIEPNVHTYGALIDGCARAGQVAKAFGAYGIMRSKKVKPDRVVFNALIAACAQSGAVDRAFDVLAEMAAETQPVKPDHITIGALMKACANAGQVERAREVYKMIHKCNIKGTPEVYTIAINACSQTGDWEFARSIYNDMAGKGLLPDEMFLSALIDVAGHAGKLDTAFEILQRARHQGIDVGNMSYSSLMGACSNAKDWQTALDLYEVLKSLNLVHTVSTVNALITALCEGDQFQKAMEVLSEMKGLGLCANSITYSILIVASEKKDDLEAGQMLLSQAKKDGVAPNLIMCRCIIGMCLRRFERSCFSGEPVLSFNSGRQQVDNKWTSMALTVYRETIRAGEMPTSDILSQILGCLRYDTLLKNRLIENLGVSTETSRSSNLSSLIDGFGEYDPRAFSLLEEAASLGIVPSVSFKVSPIVVDVKELHAFTAEVYLLTVLKGFKHRLAAGAKIPNIIILLSTEKIKVTSPKGEKIINLAGRVGQAIASLMRRLRIPYQGNESYGKLRIHGLALKKWFQPKLVSPFNGKPGDLSSSLSRWGKSISHQQRKIQTANQSLD